MADLLELDAILIRKANHDERKNRQYRPIHTLVKQSSLKSETIKKHYLFSVGLNITLVQ